ncbi:MAG: extracellular solute-binding protein, partial [Pirellulaceae bacterium]|nr:extracellular solute-binding protein [Pirellulaceae bacterium]
MSRLKTQCFFLFGCLMLLGSTGCGAGGGAVEEMEVAAKPVRSVSLDVLIIDDQKLGTVLKRQFGSRRNGVATINEMTWQELNDGAYQAARENDLLIYPSWRLGEMASRDLLEVITKTNSRLDEGRTKSLLVFDRNQAVEWGGQQIAMSLGQSQWVALYRKDVLEKLGTKVPRTWKEFDRLAEQIAELEGADLPKRIGFPLKEHWASASLLVRVAAAIRISGKYSSLFDVKTMTPQIDTEPFILSLQAMQKQLASAEEPLTPKQILAAYAGGELAIAVVPIN